MQLFEILFSLTRSIFKQFFNFFATLNKNYNQNWPCLTKDMDFLSFHSLALSGQIARRGEFSITLLFLPVLGRLSKEN
jgi:hypothetical protein